MRYFLLIFVLLVPSLAFDREKMHQMLKEDKDFMEAKNACLESLGLAEDDLKVNADGEVSEDFLCFGKCIQEKQGLIDDEGTILMEKVETLPIMAHVNDDNKKKVLDCLKELGKIESCQDVKKQRECLLQAL